MNTTDVSEQVYETLLGELIPEYSLPWVKTIFKPGHPSYKAYADMHHAYEHLRERLGVIDEDEDAEIMIDALLEYARILSKEMFHYGRIYQIMQDKEKTGA